MTIKSHPQFNSCKTRQPNGSFWLYGSSDQLVEGSTPNDPSITASSNDFCKCSWNVTRSRKWSDDPLRRTDDNQCIKHLAGWLVVRFSQCGHQTRHLFETACDSRSSCCSPLHLFSARVPRLHVSKEQAKCELLNLKRIPIKTFSTRGARKYAWKELCVLNCWNVTITTATQVVLKQAWLLMLLQMATGKRDLS